MKTVIPSPEDIERQWHLIDAEDVVLGRRGQQGRHDADGQA